VLNYNAIANLMEQAKQGYDGAFEGIYKELSRSVYYFALRIVKNQEDAEDVLQETMAALHKNLHSIKNSQAVVAYVNQIAYNQCLRILGKKKPSQTEDEGDFDIQDIADDDEEFIPEEYVERQETRAYIISLIDQLSEPLRFVIMLFYYNGLSISQIAETLKVNEGTVKTRLSRARAILKKKLESDEKGLKCIVPIPILSLILQANASEVFAAEACGDMWQSFMEKLECPEANAVAPKAPSSASKAMTRAADAMYQIAPVVATALCATLVGGNLFASQGVASNDSLMYLATQQNTTLESATIGSNTQYTSYHHLEHAGGVYMASGEQTIQLTAANSHLQYPIGSVVTAQRVLSDAVVTVLGEYVGDVAVAIAFLEKVDFNTSNRYAVYAQAIDRYGVVLAQIVIAIDVVE